jgi:hypothetical protein
VFRRRGDLPLEAVACYLCGSSEGRVLVEDPPFRVIQCSTCSLGYTTPRIRADRLQEIYDLGYFTSESAGDFGYASYAQDAPGYLETFRRKARIVQEVVPKGRLLEVGCAAGFFLKAARDAGFEAHGVEVAGSILSYARRPEARQPVPGHARGVPRAKRPSATAVMWDVVGHRRPYRGPRGARAAEA